MNTLTKNKLKKEKDKFKKGKPRKKNPWMQDPAKMQEAIVKNEYDWLAQQNMRGGPSSPDAIPFDKHISDDPEMTLAWIKSICKFAKKS
jgi:hypothetical protein